MKTEFAPLLKLSVAERLNLVEELWDSIDEDTSQLPVPEFKLEEIRRRKLEFEQHPETHYTWEEVKQYARAKDDK